jgi:hypothetical protein
MWYYIFIILVILLLTRKYIVNNRLENFTSKEELVIDNLTKQNTQIRNLLSDVVPKVNELVNNTVAQTGPQGPPGPSGPSGGIYVATGNLVNEENPEYVVDRYYGENSKVNAAFLNKDRSIFKPNQRWTLNDDKTLNNKYGGYLFSDGTDVYMKHQCTDSSCKWTWNNNGQLVWNGGKHKCLSVGSVGKTGAMEVIKGKGQMLKNKFPLLKVENCDSTLPGNQVWAFTQ